MFFKQLLSPAFENKFIKPQKHFLLN